jgi:protein-tyrosine-phosphatase
MNQPTFIFASAGLEPGVVDARAVLFMQEKGYDISRMTPKGILQVPNLDHYQVIVGLDPEVQRMFPRLPRKVVFLDWSGTDPSRVQGSYDEVKTAYEEAYDYFKAHIVDLLEAIQGTKVNNR